MPVFNLLLFKWLSDSFSRKRDTVIFVSVEKPPHKYMKRGLLEMMSSLWCLHCDRRQKEKSGAESREVENDRKGRKEGKERRKVSEGWRCSSTGSELSRWDFNVCLCKCECVCPIERFVYKSQSQAVCVLQGRCFLQCNLSLWWNVWTTSDSTPLEPPTHSISHCKQADSARVSRTGQVESL